MSRPSSNSPPHVRLTSVAALATATGAVACGVCCVLPFAVPAVSTAGAGGLLAWLGRSQTSVSALATMIVTAAWISVGRQSWRARKRPSRATLLAMTIATVVTAFALWWPALESLIIDRLR